MRSLAVAALVIAACAAPPETTPAPRPPPLLAPDGVLPEGTRLSARLTASIGTRRKLGPDRAAEITRPGQRFAAILTAPIVDSAGRTRVKTGGIVEGRLVKAVRGQGIHPARLELSVDRLCSWPLRGRVVEPDPDQIVVQPYDKTLEGATFAWLLMGTLFFGMPGFMLGTAVGSASGATARTRERTVEAWLPAGAVVDIVLDEPARLGARCVS